MLDYQGKSLRISLTPLIDVVFIMLLFFMLASTFSQWQQVSLSSVASAKSSSSDKTPAQLFVLGNSEVQYQDRHYAVSDSAFEALLNTFKTDEALLLVTAKSQATIQDIVTVMDRTVAAGLVNVSLTNSVNEN